MRPRTGQHDIDLKVRIATRLLAEGDKVKLSVMFRGRELSHPEVGQEVLDKALTGLGDLVSIEKPPGMEGRFLTVILIPNVKQPVAVKAAVADKPAEAATDKPGAAVEAETLAVAEEKAVAEEPAKIEEKAEEKVG
jgi:translation initiation factor IF-3